MKLTRGITHCKIWPRNCSEPSFETTAIIVTSITDDAKSIIRFKLLHTFKHLTLSDPQVTTPNRVHMLRCADNFPHIILGGLITEPPGSSSALEIIFGWVLIGQMHTSVNNSNNTFQLMLDTTSLEPVLNKFREIEEATAVSLTPTVGEVLCEKYNVYSVRRDEFRCYSFATVLHL